MKYKQITEILISFAKHLREEEKSQKTIEKYLRDIRHFLDFAEEREVTKALTMEYKSQLQENYAAVSANSMIASLNSFLRFIGYENCCVKQFKVQRKSIARKKKSSPVMSTSVWSMPPKQKAANG